MPGPAYEVRTPRLLIRCWSPADAPRLDAALAAGLDHLRPWLPWTRDEPLALEARVELLRGFRGRFDLGHDFVYGIFDAAGERVVGGTGLHTRQGTDAREIGYWIAAPHLRRGYATEAAAALTRVAFLVDEVRRVEIRCDPANEASIGVPRRLGFVHEGTLRGRQTAPDGEPRDTMVWTLLREELDGSPCASARVEAFDALGQPLL